MSSNYQLHAMLEFRAAGWCDETGRFKDDMQGAICRHVLALLELFAGEGNSGSSANYAVGLFEKLAKFDPITPLTGEDWEWLEVGPGSFQNMRCSHVFMNIDRFGGQPYDIQAVVFYEVRKDPDTGEEYKSRFTNWESHQPITFPYTPKIEYREVNRG